MLEAQMESCCILFMSHIGKVKVIFGVTVESTGHPGVGWKGPYEVGSLCNGDLFRQWRGPSV